MTPYAVPSLFTVNWQPQVMPATNLAVQNNFNNFNLASLGAPQQYPPSNYPPQQNMGQPPQMTPQQNFGQPPQMTPQQPPQQNFGQPPQQNPQQFNNPNSMAQLQF